MNATLLIVMRIAHVVGGVVWVGAAAFALFLLNPAMKALGPLGGRMMEQLTTKQKYSTYMSVSSMLTVLSGIYLYTYASGSFNLNWITSGSGIVFTIGSVAALVAFMMGITLMKPRGEKINALGKKIGMTEGAPDPDLLREMHDTESELNNIGNVEFVFLAVALLTMAVARYMHF